MLLQVQMKVHYIECHFWQRIMVCYINSVSIVFLSALQPLQALYFVHVVCITSMQCGVHLIFGMMIALLSSESSFKVAAVFGAIAPDIDIPFAVVAVVMMQDPNYADIIHRSVTHSLLISIICPLILWMTLHHLKANKVTSKYLPLIMLHDRNAQHKANKCNDRKSIQTATLLWPALGFFLGLMSHNISDMLYMKGVMWLWPFCNDLISVPNIVSSVSDWKKLSQTSVQLLEASDHLTDLLCFWPVIIYLCYQHDLHPIGRRRAIVFCITKGIIACIFIVIAIFCTAISFETYFILLYIWGTPSFIVCTIAPILFADAVGHIPTIRYVKSRNTYCNFMWLLEKKDQTTL